MAEIQNKLYYISGIVKSIAWHRRDYPDFLLEPSVKFCAAAVQQKLSRLFPDISIRIREHDLEPDMQNRSWTYLLVQRHDSDQIGRCGNRQK